MTKGRLEAFSDGVIAILITIMVLELKVPSSPDWRAAIHDHELLATFGSYALSFVYLGIYWTNHHHLLHAASRVNGAVLWANLHLLFWLSLVPFGTRWLGETSAAPMPTAAYGVVMFLAAIAYWILVNRIIAAEGEHSRLAAAIGRDIKGKISPVLYLAAIPLAFVNSWISIGLYVFVALMWLVPDRRIERTTS